MKRKILYVIHDDPNDDNKSFWHRAGIGFLNKDGSVNIQLDVMPGTKFQLRDPPEEK